MNRLLRALAVVAALAWGVPAHAAVAYVNGDARSGNTSAAVNVTTGNLLVVGTRTNSGYVASVSDTAGNRFIRAFAYNHASQPIELWYARNVTGHASDQVTVSYASGGGFPYLAVAQYSGVSTTTVLDALAWGTGNATSATSSSISTLTANQAIVAFGSSSSGGSSAVAITGYTRRLIDSGNVVALFDNIVSATQSGVTAAAGPWGGANSTVIVATFSETAVPHGITVLSSANSASSQTGTNIAASAYSSVAGNLIVAVVRHANGTISSVTDTAGDTFTRAIGPIGTDPDVELWYAANVAGHSSNAVTANFSASGSFRSIVVTEYEGLQAATPLDATDSGTAAGTTVTSAGFTTTTANQLIVFGGSTNLAGCNTCTTSGSYIRRWWNTELALFDRIVTTTQSGVTAAITFTGGNAAALTLGTFKVTSGGGGGGGGGTFNALLLGP
jgi:hypothetical protein